MSEQKRTKTYAIIAAIGIAILAVSLVGGFWNTEDSSIVPKANGKISNDFATKQIAGTSTFVKSEEQDNVFQLFVTGTAAKKISPDKVSVTLGVETQEKTAQEAAAKNAEIMSQVINGLKAIGVNEKQISTSYYNINPVYEYRKMPVYEEEIVPPHPQNQVLVGYRVTNTITITVSADQNIGEIIDIAVNAGANQVQHVSYFVSEETQRQMNDELIGQAVLNAKSKAEKALVPLNMQIVGVKNLNLNDVYYPIYKYDRAVLESAASAPTPILPSEQQVSVSISVTFIIG